MKNRDLYQSIMNYAIREDLGDLKGYLYNKILDGPQYWQTHPLGFFVSRDLFVDEGALRLHVWPEGWSVPDDQQDADVHDHVFEFRSLVLLGSVINDTFEAIESNSGEYKTVEISYSNNNSGGTNVGDRRCNLIKTSSSVYSKGESYFMPAGVIHKGGAQLSPSVTLLATRPNPKFAAPRILISEPFTPPPAFSRSIPNAVQWDKISTALKAIFSSSS